MIKPIPGLMFSSIETHAPPKKIVGKFLETSLAIWCLKAWGQDVGSDKTACSYLVQAMWDVGVLARIQGIIWEKNCWRWVTLEACFHLVRSSKEQFLWITKQVTTTLGTYLNRTEIKENLHLILSVTDLFSIQGQILHLERMLPTCWKTRSWSQSSKKSPKLKQAGQECRKT